jgi:hypothetical protein
MEHGPFTDAAMENSPFILILDAIRSWKTPFTGSFPS